MTGLSLVDRTCSGATRKHVLYGGQFFQGAQIEAVSATTELVTVTVGGNDVNYVADLTSMGKRGSVLGLVMRMLPCKPKPANEGNFAEFSENLNLILQ